MHRLAALALALGICAGSTAAPAAATPSPVHPRPATFSPGAAGLGDPYFPQEGNGGYRPVHYDLNLSYQPDRHQLAGVATLVARATQNLSRFDLDLQGLTVRRVTVDGLAASFTRKGQELIITPPFGLLAGTPFVVMVRYDGSPKTVEHSPRGFMTLALLRHKIGDAKFFTLLRTWTRTHRNSTGTTAQFVALAEQISGLKLESFFQAWLFQKKQPRWPG